MTRAEQRRAERERVKRLRRAKALATVATRRAERDPSHENLARAFALNSALRLAHELDAGARLTPAPKEDS